MSTPSSQESSVLKKKEGGATQADDDSKALQAYIKINASYRRALKAEKEKNAELNGDMTRLKSHLQTMALSQSKIVKNYNDQLSKLKEACVCNSSATAATTTTNSSGGGLFSSILKKQTSYTPVPSVTKSASTVIASRSFEALAPDIKEEAEARFTEISAMFNKSVKTGLPELRLLLEELTVARQSLLKQSDRLEAEKKIELEQNRAFQKQITNLRAEVKVLSAAKQDQAATIQALTSQLTELKISSQVENKTLAAVHAGELSRLREEFKLKDAQLVQKDERHELLQSSHREALDALKVDHANELSRLQEEGRLKDAQLLEKDMQYETIQNDHLKQLNAMQAEGKTQSGSLAAQLTKLTADLHARENQMVTLKEKRNQLFLINQKLQQETVRLHARIDELELVVHSFQVAMLVPPVKDGNKEQKLEATIFIRKIATNGQVVISIESTHQDTFTMPLSTCRVVVEDEAKEKSSSVSTLPVSNVRLARANTYSEEASFRALKKSHDKKADVSFEVFHLIFPGPRRYKFEANALLRCSSSIQDLIDIV